MSVQSNYPRPHFATRAHSPLAFLDVWFEKVAPAPWGATVGLHVWAPAQRPLYTAEERQRRDQTGWTVVQAVLAPIQFLAFAVSLVLVIRYLATGQGYDLATASILIKTGLLYTIMITGSIWEKKVFGQWLFAPAFFWEDVFSFLVLALQTAYLAGTLLHLATPVQQMEIAIAAYAAYAVNAGQFVIKLRQARIEAGRYAATAAGRAA